jgi:hypothetical protein
MKKLTVLGWGDVAFAGVLRIVPVLQQELYFRSREDCCRRLNRGQRASSRRNFYSERAKSVEKKRPRCRQRALSAGSRRGGGKMTPQAKKEIVGMNAPTSVQFHGDVLAGSGHESCRPTNTRFIV